MFPPDRGICHQVNLEFLAQVVFRDGNGLAYPDTLVGTDSHTPMVNGLGVLGWGVGGIEAEAAMLGQSISMLLPQGGRHQADRRAAGRARPPPTSCSPSRNACAQHGVVGKLVEFYGEGVGRVPLENRATIGNMTPEYGSTSTLFPVDDETLRYLRATGRPDDLVALVETYAKEQGLWHDPDSVPQYDETIELDLATDRAVAGGPGPSAGPRGALEREGRFRDRARRSAARRRRDAAAPEGTGRARRRPRVRRSPTARS